MDTENKPNPDKIEESFLSIIEEFKESYSGLFIKGATDPEVIKEGDLEKIGKSLKRMSEFLNMRLQDLEFQGEEDKIKKIKSRLEKTTIAIYEMGNEIESKKTQEPMDYHWYVVGALAVSLIGLFDYIEMYTD